MKSGGARPIDTVVAIETPEHIVFHHAVAGPARRACAHVLDLLLCYALVAVVCLVALGASVGSTGGAESAAKKAGTGLVLLVLFGAQWIWFVCWEALRGASPGKRWLGLRVLTTSGRPIGFRAAALRNLLRAADLLPTAYLLGLASMVMTVRFQRLGDIVAGTMVVATRALAAPHRRGGATHGIELRPPAQPNELATLPDAVDLDADEREAIELFLRRRASLARAREHELAAMIAAPITRRLGFVHPDPARALAILYDRAVSAGRVDAPVSSRAATWR